MLMLGRVLVLLAKSASYSGVGTPSAPRQQPVLLVVVWASSCSTAMINLTVIGEWTPGRQLGSHTCLLIEPHSPDIW